MCVSCRTMKPKKEMIRLVKTASSVVAPGVSVESPVEYVSIDITGKASGRGAYICIDKACIEAAKKQKRIERSFHVSKCDNLYEALVEMAEEDKDAKKDAQQILELPPKREARATGN